MNVIFQTTPDIKIFHNIHHRVIYIIYITCRIFISIQQLQRKTNNENKDKYLVK